MAPAPATLTSTLPYNGREDYKDMLHCDKPLFTEQVYSTTTIVCRANLFICLTPADVDVVLAGGHIAAIDPLFLTQCGCSNKCSVLVNHPASQSTLNALECSNWGAHLIEGKSTALGLLLYGKFSRSPQGWISVEELAGTQAINPKAMSKANHRLALFATPAHSVVQRKPC